MSRLDNTKLKVASLRIVVVQPLEPTPFSLKHAKEPSFALHRVSNLVELDLIESAYIDPDR